MLWDRIIGFDSLELLPVLAAAIFVYRAKWLLQASELAHVQRLLADATGLRVVPLLQLFLSDHTACALPATELRNESFLFWSFAYD